MFAEPDLRKSSNNGPMEFSKKEQESGAEQSQARWLRQNVLYRIYGELTPVQVVSDSGRPVSIHVEGEQRICAGNV